LEIEYRDLFTINLKLSTISDYAHAEARKSPALDGKVERDKDGKERFFRKELNLR